MPPLTTEKPTPLASEQVDAAPAEVAAPKPAATRRPNLSASAEIPVRSPYDPVFAERIPILQCFRFAMHNALAQLGPDETIWVAECGVYRGRALRALAMVADDVGVNVRFVGLDSFEGLPDLSDNDLAHAPSNARYRREVLFADTTEREVAAYVSDVNTGDRITFVKGFFEDTLKTLPERQYAFVDIDCDLYEGHIECLEYFYNKMIRGGMIFLDDYHSELYPMGKAAVNDFLKDKPEKVFTMYFGDMDHPKAFLIRG